MITGILTHQINLGKVKGMNKLKVIVKKNEKVLMTEHLAESFETEAKLLHNNFSYNKKHFVEGKHYFELKGDELKQFKTDHEIQGKLKHAPVIYLWTKKGAFLHAKSLNTDKAWSAYSDLIDDYFEKVEMMQNYGMKPTIPTTIEDLMIMAAENMKEIKAELSHLQLVVDNEIVLTKQQRGAIRDAVMTRQGQLNAEGYTQKHFQAIYRAINQHFGVAEYADINRTDFERAISIIKGWYPKKAEENA